MERYIDIQAQELISTKSVKQRFAPSIINRLDGVSDQELSARNVQRIDYIETPQPTVESWETVSEGPVDKTTPGLWRTTWTVTIPSVAQAVAMRKAAIEQERDALRNADDATVTLADGRVFQTDPLSRDLMNQAKSNADLNGGFAVDAIWRAADNTNHPRTTALFAEISLKEEARQQPIWYISWALKEEIKAIAESEQLTDDEKVTAIMTQQWGMPAPTQ